MEYEVHSSGVDINSSIPELLFLFQNINVPASKISLSRQSDFLIGRDVVDQNRDAVAKRGERNLPKIALSGNR